MGVSSFLKLLCIVNFGVFVVHGCISCGGLACVLKTSYFFVNPLPLFSFPLPPSPSPFPFCESSTSLFLIVLIKSGRPVEGELGFITLGTSQVYIRKAPNPLLGTHLELCPVGTMTTLHHKVDSAHTDFLIVAPKKSPFSESLAQKAAVLICCHCKSAEDFDFNVFSVLHLINHLHLIHCLLVRHGLHRNDCTDQKGQWTGADSNVTLAPDECLQLRVMPSAQPTVSVGAHGGELSPQHLSSTSGEDIHLVGKGWLTQW